VVFLLFVLLSMLKVSFEAHAFFLFFFWGRSLPLALFLSSGDHTKRPRARGRKGKQTEKQQKIKVAESTDRRESPSCLPSLCVLCARSCPLSVGMRVDQQR
jgi:hypothetical protein